ncbi:hypothetical protein ACJMK2_030581 [Sinanodonta woodiana]|uniref:Telomeric repeat-binding factor 2-interacting protein 1 n=1 Tax=Sinanodonta woodiana TaxID=1069815 RepID=A0ABD3WZM7_SINWO
MQNMAGRQNFDNCSHNETLFKQDDGSRIVFYMRPCEEREKLRPVIEHGGGKITSKYIQGSIKLAEKGAVITTDDYLAAKYVEDCVQENKLLDPVTYKLKKGQHSSSTRKDKNGVVLDDMDPAEVILCTKSRNKSSKGTEGRSMYTLEDDLAMLDYIVTEVKYNETGGYQVFRDMQTGKVTKHSFMSMHTRFRKHILPNIDKYDIPNRWKYLITGDSKYDKRHQTGVEALFKLKENPENQTRSPKKKGLFSHSKSNVQMTENQSVQKGSDLLKSRNSSTKKIITKVGKQTCTDETNPTISPAKGSKVINNNSEEEDKVADIENQKKNKSMKQNTKNIITPGGTSNKRRNRMLFDEGEAVSSPIQSKQVKDSKPLKATSPLEFKHASPVNKSNIGKTGTPREESSIMNQTAVVSHRKAEAEENINHGEANVAKKDARVPDRLQNKANSFGGLVQQIKSPVKRQNEKDSESISQAKMQKNGSSDFTINENSTQTSKYFPMNSVEVVSVGLMQGEKDQLTQQFNKARYEPLKFINRVKQGGQIASQEHDASKTVHSNNRMQNQQVGNATDKGTDKNLTICIEQFSIKSVPSSSNIISMDTRNMKNGDKQKIQSENSVDAVDNENKALDSDSDTFATADNAEITVSDDDASFISCEDEFDRHLLEKLETSNSKSGTSSDLKTQKTCMKDLRRKNASNFNRTNDEQNGIDSTKGKSPIKRKSDSLEQLESSDEESPKIKNCRKLTPSKQGKTPADSLIYIDSLETAESETAGENHPEDAKSRKSHRTKSGGGWNRFVDYSSVESEIVEDIVEEEEEEEKEVALEETVSGRGNKRSAKNPAPYLDQILDTDVESQTDDLTQNPAADHTAEIYDFQEDDTDEAQVKEVCEFLTRTAEQFSLNKTEVFEILLSCNGDTRRAVNWIRFGKYSFYLSPWKPSDDKKLMKGEDIVRLELVYGAEEVRERALFLEILERQ